MDRSFPWAHHSPSQRRLLCDSEHRRIMGTGRSISPPVNGRRRPDMATKTKTSRSATPLPLQNQLLAALPPADYKRILPHLELVELPLGLALYEPGSRLSYVY